MDLDNLLDADMLLEYSSACTTRILGLAAEECGRSSYHIDQVFSRYDLMDPDFQTENIDDIDICQGFVTPQDILTDICMERVEFVVKTIGYMEDCWTNYSTSVPKEYQIVAQKLWEFVKDEAEQHVQSLYGDEYMEEFATMGDFLFINQKGQELVK